MESLEALLLAINQMRCDQRGLRWDEIKCELNWLRGNGWDEMR